MLSYITISETIDFFISIFAIVEYIFFNTQMLKKKFLGFVIPYFEESCLV